MKQSKIGSLHDKNITTFNQRGTLQELVSLTDVYITDLISIIHLKPGNTHGHKSGELPGFPEEA